MGISSWVEGSRQVRARWSRGSALLLLLGVAIFSNSSASDTVTYTYDGLGRLKSIAFTDGTSVTYSLDGAGNRVTVTTATDTTPPSVPTGLSASASTSTLVNLSWTASTDTGGSGLAGYKIFRGGTQVGSSTTTSYADSTVVGSTLYSYTVLAYDNANNSSAQSSAATVTTPDSIAPSVPTGLAATAVSSTQVNLSWAASTDTGGSGLAGYKVYRGGTLLGTSATASYSDTTTVGSTAYSYTVAAYDHAGNNSSQSSAANVTTPDTIAPSVPTGLSATAVSSTQVNLSWAASTDTGGSGLAGYKVYRGGTLLVSTASLAYSDTTVLPSTAYSYTVAAYDNAGNVSAQSTASNVTTPAGVPPNPTLSSSTTLGTAGVFFTLSWTSSTGATSYKLFSSGTLIYTVTGLSQQVTEPQGNYSFNAQACNANGCSTGSNSVSVTICPARGCQ